MHLNINADGFVKMTAKLERLNKSALPLAVRNTLNSTAFDVKKTTMPAIAKKTFIERKSTFFQANSKVVPAQGLSIAGMKATVGFQPKSGNDKSVDDLEQQEHGGSIGGRSFIPLAQARTGNSWKKNVKARVRISDIKGKVIDAKNAPGKNDKEKWTKSAIHAGKGGFVIGTGGQKNKILFQIRSIVRQNKNTVIKAVPLFAVRKGRKVSPKATGFMSRASLQSAGKMEAFYGEHAKKQVEKLMR